MKIEVGMKCRLIGKGYSKYKGVVGEIEFIRVGITGKTYEVFLEVDGEPTTCYVKRENIVLVNN